MAILTKNKLESILTKRLSLKDPMFFLEKTGDRLFGDVVSPTFKGKRDDQRQKLIWKALQSELGNDSTTLVGMLLAFTPDEWNVEIPKTSSKKKAG